MSNHPLTENLYRELRTAYFSRNKHKSYDLLRQIVEIDPTDESARSQLDESGKQLVQEVLPQLEDVFKENNVDLMMDLIKQMRLWAPESYLQQQPIFAKVAPVVDQINKENYLDQAVRYLQQIDTYTSRQDSYDLATKAEKLSAEYGFSFSDSQQKLIDRLKFEWCAYINEKEESKTISEISDDFKINAACSNKQMNYFDDGKLDLIKQKIVSIEKQLEGHTHREDALELKKSCIRQKHSIDLILTKRRDAKKRIKLYKNVLIGVGGLVVGLFALAFSTVGESINKLENLYEDFQPDVCEETVGQRGPMHYFYQLISPSYKNLYLQQEEKWRKFCTLRDEFTNHAKYLKHKNGVFHPSDFKEDIKHFHYAEINFLQIQKDYGYILSEIWNEHDLYVIVEGLKKSQATYMNRLVNMDAYLSIEQLAKSYQEFRDTVPYLSMNNAGQEDIQKKFVSKACDFLLCSGDRNEIIQKRKKFSQYQSLFPLPQEIDQDLHNYLADLPRKDQFLAELAKCDNFSDYIQLLKKNTNLVKSLENIGFLRNLNKINRQLPTLALTLSIQNTPFCSEGDDDVEKAINHFQAILGIFTNKSNIYNGKYSKTLSNLIKEINSEDYWTDQIDQDDLKMVEANGKSYIGIISSIDDSLSLATYEDISRGRSVRKKFSKSECKTASVNLGNIRKSYGIDSLDMEYGKIHPVEIMDNIAACKDTNVPVLAKAYLFGKMIEMLEAFKDPLASGIPLSPHLRLSIERFNELKKLSNPSLASWLKTQDLTVVNVWKQFFSKLSEKPLIDDIKRNLAAINRSELRIIGYVDEKGNIAMPKIYRSKKIYYVDFDQEDGSSQLELYRPQCKLIPFTPIFVFAPKDFDEL